MGFDTYRLGELERILGVHPPIMIKTNTGGTLCHFDRVLEREYHAEDPTAGVDLSFTYIPNDASSSSADVASLIKERIAKGLANLREERLEKGLASPFTLSTSHPRIYDILHPGEKSGSHAFRIQAAGKNHGGVRIDYGVEDRSTVILSVHGVTGFARDVFNALLY
jgi:hypothetical protein